MPLAEVISLIAETLQAVVIWIRPEAYPGKAL